MSETVATIERRASEEFQHYLTIYEPCRHDNIEFTAITDCVIRLYESDGMEPPSGCLIGDLKLWSARTIHGQGDEVSTVPVTLEDGWDLYHRASEAYKAKQYKEALQASCRDSWRASVKTLSQIPLAIGVGYCIY